MKRLLSFITILTISASLLADEGMWLPALISQRIGDMQSKGFKLTAEDIYSINQASLKDAVVLFNRGCTGELISDKGLLLTNHHCGYSQIQKHSSVEHDYLKDGFWAMTMEDELPNENLVVDFLERMEDVTEKVLDGYTVGMTELQRDSVVKANSKELIAEATKEGKGLRAQVEALYYGNQYFIFVFRTFSDVRLVGAPPSSIGKFGGDTDNWMWPRHTGDFSLFRIYADKENNPAPYSEDNVPYKPKKYFKVSAKGVKEGDFTFVYGFPGSTREYITSDAVHYNAEISNPHKIKLRTHRLDAQRKYMSKDQAVRIMYSAKNASVSNAWKKWQGEMKGIRKMNTVEVKKEYEKRFREWAKGTEYEGVLDQLAGLYAQLEPYSFANDYYRESVLVVELPAFARRIQRMVEKGDDPSAAIAAFYKDYYLPIDKECFISLVKEFDANVPASFKPEYFTNTLAQYPTVEAWADDMYTKSAFISEKDLSAAIAIVGAAQGDLAKAMDDDPAIKFYKALVDFYNGSIYPQYTSINKEITLLYRDYMRGQMEFDKEKAFYPDANLTLRVAYGKIAGYSPSDAVYFTPSSSIEGIMQKDNPEIFDYNIPQELRDIYARKDYGEWANENGTIPVCFIATNHTSGGNSGSPVIDGDGNLIGLNFDRVWEGTMSDVVFDPDVCRNISLDVRFVLFTIDKLAKNHRLLEEMEIIR